jgi:hypothetical protein
MRLKNLRLNNLKTNKAIKSRLKKTILAKKQLRVASPLAGKFDNIFVNNKSKESIADHKTSFIDVRISKSFN